MTSVHAQNRGVYPLGLSAINSGVSAEPGLTYNNSFLFYSRDEQKGGNGEVVATGQQSVLLDMNTLLWASTDEISTLGGAGFSSAVTIPIANNSLSSSSQGAISGGGGLGDLYFQPVILGWREERADIRGILGVLAPTGRFSAGATDNVGNGYWTPVVAAGETFYLSADRATTLSAFEMYEFHSIQSGTAIHPGETLDLDYSLMRAFAFADSRLQAGLVGYGAWQTTAKTGPNITPSQEAQRYRVNSLGFGLNYVLPARKVSLGFKYFDEFSNQWTYQGYSVQISIGIGF
ncbi:MAG TPA: transporter [Steroidobacteraceae bacterium]|nr:transporter [Steroidobacteraceae bacterium]